MLSPGFLCFAFGMLVKPLIPPNSLYLIAAQGNLVFALCNKIPVRIAILKLRGDFSRGMPNVNRLFPRSSV